MDKNSKILVLGAKGMVGSAISKALKSAGYTNVIDQMRDEWGSSDLTQKQSVANIFSRKQPEYVFLCAAKVGGIMANDSLPVSFLETNLAIQNNVIKQCFENKVKRLIFLGSSCIYPKHAQQPIKEEALMTGHLEPTNSAYAVAKIAGIELCKSYNKQYGTEFISVMPCNLYGDNDRYIEDGHVIPMLIRKFQTAIQNHPSTVQAWGTGTPLREFMHADDLAECLIQLMNVDQKLPDIINVGTGEEVSIRDLTEIISNIMKFSSSIIWLQDLPDGTPRKVLDCTLLKSILPNWKPKYTLEEGLKSVINKL